MLPLVKTCFKIHKVVNKQTNKNKDTEYKQTTSTTMINNTGDLEIKEKRR